MQPVYDFNVLYRKGKNDRGLIIEKKKNYEMTRTKVFHDTNNIGITLDHDFNSFEIIGQNYLYLLVNILITYRIINWDY